MQIILQSHGKMHQNELHAGATLLPRNKNHKSKECKPNIVGFLLLPSGFQYDSQESHQIILQKRKILKIEIEMKRSPRLEC